MVSPPNFSTNALATSNATTFSMTTLAAGTAQKAHVLQTQTEISAFENDLITLTQRRETVRARLNTLLDLPPATPLAEPAKPALLRERAAAFSIARAAASYLPLMLGEEAS